MADCSRDPSIEIRNTWTIFPVGEHDPIHLRAIWGKGAPTQTPMNPRNLTFTAQAYPNIGARQRVFEEKALELNHDGYNIYTTLNPIKMDFGGDERNKLAVKDDHITRRRYILIDIDRVKSDCPINAEEASEVLAVAKSISTYLWSAPT